jgi:hypothetical protein
LDLVVCLRDRMTSLQAAWSAAMVCAVLVGAAAGEARAAEVVLPVDVSAIAQEIAVEIDGADLTEFIRVEDGQLVVLASAALEPGPHVAAIYVLEGDGYRVYATYDFDVPAAPDPNVKITLEAEHEAGVTSDPGGTEGHVASSGTVAVETVDHSLTARLSYVADTREENQIAGRFADIAEYSIELRQSGALLDLTARVGHQSLGFDPALVADLNRRGLSVEGAGPEERLQFHLFALKASAAEGAENILGIAEGNDRIVGGRLAFRPVFGSDFRISFQGFEGEGAPDFSLITGIGSGKGLALDGSLVDGRLRYGLTWAETLWDGDAAGALPEDRGQALLATFAYDLQPANGAALTLGFDYERVDLFYYSPANPALPTGGETLRLSADYAAERLTLYGTLETTLTNEGGDPADPVDRVNRLALDGTWALYDAGLLPDATLTFGISLEDLRRVETPPAAPGPEDWSGTTAYMGLEKYSDTAGWSLIYTYLREEDDGPGNFDLTGHELSATLDLVPSDRFALAATGLVGSYESMFSGSYQRFDGDIGLDYALEPDLWLLSLDLGVSQTTEPGIEDGRYAAAAVTRKFANGAELVMNAGWYDGTFAETSGPEEETIFGLTYRIRSDKVH